MIHNSLRKSHLKAAAVVSVGAFCAITCSTTAAVAADGPHGWHGPHYIYRHHEKIETKIFTKTKRAERGKTVKVDVWCPTHWVATGGGYSIKPDLLFEKFWDETAKKWDVKVNGAITESRPTPAPHTEAKDWKVVYTPADFEKGWVTAWVVCAHEER